MVPHPPNTPNATSSPFEVFRVETRNRLIPLTMGDETVHRRRQMNARTTLMSVCLTRQQLTSVRLTSYKASDGVDKWSVSEHADLYTSGQRV